MKTQLEIACFNIQSAIIAAHAGAHRVELCDNYLIGGTTPSLETLKIVRDQISIPVYVIIRPRDGNFVYSSSEVDSMEEVIFQSKRMGADGFVFGALTPEHSVDESVCIRLLKAAGNAPSTFHRAIDKCHNIESEITKLIHLGFDKVLTSGGADTAMKGIQTIKELQKKFGTEITVMPGGGVRSSNLSEFLARTGCHDFHSAAIKSGSTHASKIEIKNLLTILNKA